MRYTSYTTQNGNVNSISLHIGNVGVSNGHKPVPRFCKVMIYQMSMVLTRYVHYIRIAFLNLKALVLGYGNFHTVKYIWVSASNPAKVYGAGEALCIHQRAAEDEGFNIHMYTHEFLLSDLFFSPSGTCLIVLRCVILVAICGFKVILC